jgi:murein DD-endopeptidase MepM/ murein hydrolase activator NlpD
LALSEHDAQSSSTAETIALDGPIRTEDRGGDRSPDGSHRRRWRRRAGVAALLAGLALVAAGVLPATAGWPVATRSSYVSQWKSTRHVAIDIAATKWTKIIPIKAGKVVFAGWRSNCGGYQVWVSHGNGLYSAYYHLAREVSYRGEWLSSGETLGYLGTTGCATGPHLHIEVWRGYPWRSGSSRVNPWTYVDSGYYLPYRYR